MVDYNVTDTLVYKIAHTGIALPELDQQVAAGCLVEGEPGLFYPITSAGRDSYGEPVNVTACDPTHQLVRGQLTPINP